MKVLRSVCICVALLLLVVAGLLVETSRSITIVDSLTLVGVIIGCFVGALLVGFLACYIDDKIKKNSHPR